MRNVIWLMAVIWCALAGLLAAPAQAEKRVALVIGNGSYAHIAGLPNVPNDAAAMARLFKAAKFDAVDVMHNLGVAELRRALKLFAGRAADADVAVLFYAGHGIEVGQVNYLIPVDARLVTDFDVEDETVPLDRVLQAMEPAKRLRLVILDACRENPFLKSMKRTVAARSIGRGLGRIEPATTNTLIAYATKPNAIAEDGKGPNSPFTAALVKHLLTPGLDLRIALGHVRDEVLRVTGNKQEPYVTGSLGGGIVSINEPESQTAGVAGAYPAVAQLRYQMSYAKGRAILIDGGWQPIRHPWQTIEERCSARRRICMEYVETASCSGTGSAFCRFEFVEANGERLVVITVREDLEQLTIDNWWLEEAQAKRAGDEAERQRLAILKAEQDRAAEEAKKRAAADLLRPGREFRDCSDLCPMMVVVPAGEFMMGSPPGEAGRIDDEGPQRKVTIARPFAVGKYEVTFAEWDACVADGGCKHRADAWRRVHASKDLGRRPANDVSWNDAQEYSSWLSRKTGKTYRLLSEAEWEYAARAGTTTPYSTGQIIAKSQANFGNTKLDMVSFSTVDVGSFLPNSFGLHDMHGNVEEWVQDCWNANYNSAPSHGSAWTTGDCGRRVLRGGSWINDTPHDLRSAYRSGASPNLRLGIYGFRVGRTL